MNRILPPVVSSAAAQAALNQAVDLTTPATAQILLSIGIITEQWHGDHEAFRGHCIIAITHAAADVGAPVYHSHTLYTNHPNVKQELEYHSND